MREQETDPAAPEHGAESPPGHASPLEDALHRLGQHLPAPLRDARARASRFKSSILQKIVDRFFPTNSSGNNMSRG